MFPDESFFIWGTELKWCSAGAARIYCGGGIVAFSMPEVPRVWDANCVQILRGEENGAAASMLPLAEIEARVRPVYAASGCTKHSFYLPYDDLCPGLCAEFEAAGYEKEITFGMLREGPPPEAVPLPPGITISSDPEANQTFLKKRHASGGARLTLEEIAALEGIKNPIMGTRWFTAVLEGRPVAHLGMFASDGTGRFQDVMTMQDFRGRGLSTALAAHAMRVFAVEHGCQRFALLVSATGPVTLYERWGFRKAGSVTGYRKDNESAPGEAKAAS